MIYLPATCDIITAGHIRVFRQLARSDELIVGLLDEKALQGYKDVVMPYDDRKEILEAIHWIDEVVRQSSLNPYENLIKYKITHIASGDGFEPEELKAIKKAGVSIINIKLPNETTKLYSSTKIKSKIKRKIKKLCQLQQ